MVPLALRALGLADEETLMIDKDNAAEAPRACKFCHGHAWRPGRYVDGRCDSCGLEDEQAVRSDPAVEIAMLRAQVATQQKEIGILQRRLNAQRSEQHSDGRNLLDTIDAHRARIMELAALVERCVRAVPEPKEREAILADLRATIGGGRG